MDSVQYQQARLIAQTYALTSHKDGTYSVRLFLDSNWDGSQEILELLYDSSLNPTGWNEITARPAQLLLGCPVTLLSDAEPDDVHHSHVF